MVDASEREKIRAKKKPRDAATVLNSEHSYLFEAFFFYNLCCTPLPLFFKQNQHKYKEMSASTFLDTLRKHELSQVNQKKGSCY